MKLMHILSIALLLTLSACTTTSDIVTLSNNSYQVSSLACPACGGISKSQNLAREKANDFCAAKGEVAIIDNLDNETVNAYGAGSTAMNFRCGQANVQDSVQECYHTLLTGLEGTYGGPIVEMIGSKVTPSETNYFGFEQLSDAAIPSEEEAGVIKKYGSGSSKCERIRAGAMSIDRQEMWLSAQNRRLSALAQLANGQISYGDYAVKLNNAAERLYYAEDGMMQRRADEAKRDAAERRRAMDNMGNMIQDSMKTKPTTNCTSTVSGDQVNTTCR
ncbi:MAG: hypothetical protein NZ730_03855 [Porticoccaceae bacterium]|nr:hypothetical protein [Porticoccaceae bacterium]